MVIEHRPGRKHGNADGLSRIPCRQCGLMTDTTPDDKKVTKPVEINMVTNIQPNSMVNEFRTLQEEDPDIRTAISWVRENSKPPFRDIASGSYRLKSLWNQYELLTLQDEILVRTLIDTDQPSKVLVQKVVPIKQRRKVLEYAHDIRASGHLGIKKTLAKIRHTYYWPGLQSDVRMYVAGSETCAKRKGPNRTKQAPMQIVRSGYPMERIAIDILGELPRTDSGNRYIVVIADYFTEWTECFPMKDMEATTVAKILVEEVVTRFGIPSIIHSDQGRQFEGKVFQEMCQLLRIEKTRTTPYHPQSDGMVERFNRTLTAMLTAYVNEHHTNWDDQIPYVLMAYRSSEHETTGMTPNKLMLGREVCTPLDLIFDMPRTEKQVPTNQWVWELQERMVDAHEMVRQNIGTAMHRQKKIHDKRKNFETFEPDDRVLVYFPVKKVGM